LEKVGLDSEKKMDTKESRLHLERNKQALQNSLAFASVESIWLLAESVVVSKLSKWFGKKKKRNCTSNPLLTPSFKPMGIFTTLTIASGPFLGLQCF
jgi:hypothetical protein